METARLWHGFGHWSRRAARSTCTGVTGPDEYSALVDDNVFTNLMARRNLRGAADAAEDTPTWPGGSAWTTAEVAGWRAAADAMFIPYDGKRGVHEQSAGFTEQPEWDFAGTERGRLPAAAALPLPGAVPQAGGQAGRPGAGHAALPGGVHRRGEGPQLRLLRGAHRPRLVAVGRPRRRCSPPRSGTSTWRTTCSPSRSLQDLADLGDKTADGLHLASLAGAWLALVQGFGGLRDDRGGALLRAPAARAGSTGSRSACAGAATGCGSRSPPGGPLRAARRRRRTTRSSCGTTASSSGSPARSRSPGRCRRCPTPGRSRPPRPAAVPTGRWPPDRACRRGASRPGGRPPAIRSRDRLQRLEGVRPVVALEAAQPVDRGVAVGAVHAGDGVRHLGVDVLALAEDDPRDHGLVVHAGERRRRRCRTR